MTDAPAGTIRVEVRLFAGLREVAGVSRTTLHLPSGTSAGGAVDALWAALGVVAPDTRGGLVLAVDREYADPATPLRDGGELALIPPVSGGAPAGPDAPRGRRRRRSPRSRRRREPACGR